MYAGSSTKTYSSSPSDDSEFVGRAADILLEKD
jgi:hypothetical protein